jgi:hypothetical protein
LIQSPRTVTSKAHKKKRGSIPNQKQSGSKNPNRNFLKIVHQSSRQIQIKNISNQFQIRFALNTSFLRVE